MRPDPAGTQLLIRRRRSARSRLLITAASGAVVLLAAGCSGGGGAGTPVSGTITIAATPGIEDAPLYLAQAKGLFAAEGLHVQITSYGSQAADLAAVESGKAQIADTDYGNVFTVEQSAGNLRILADGFDASSGTAEIVIAPTAPIGSPLKLPKYSVGVPSEYSIPAPANQATGPTGTPPSELAAAATTVLTNYLISNAQVLNWSAMSEQQEVQELGDGLLKAALLTEPYLYEAESQYGDTELLDAFSGQTANMPMSGYVATEAWVKSNSAAVADFQAAISQAQADSALNGPVQQELPKMAGAGINAQTADMVTLGTYPTQTSTTALQRVQTMLSERGMLTGATQMSVSQLVVPSG
jgi:NitT/TauT family transport system substrate-binding protein